jgi:transposase
MNLLHIIGADLSKDSIDLACTESQSYLRINNSLKGFRQLLNWLRDLKIKTSAVMIVMEHTGLYSYQMEKFLHRHQVAFTKIPALAIKRSLGLIRGKNDKIDAYRIARYGLEKRDILVAEKELNKTLERLKMLHSARSLLVKQRASLICAVKEVQELLKQSDLIIKSYLHLINDYSTQIKKIEAEMTDLIKKDLSVNQNFKLLKTIKGVGNIVAIAMIVKTRNFTMFPNARKFACYCGTAPFEYYSGKSIRRKTRISHLADKKMKTLLDQSAKTAIQYDKELKTFYERRIDIGKSKKSTINIVRNKIIYRMFAVIKRQTPFIENYLQTA